MEKELSATRFQKVFDGEGSFYYIWSSEECPILSREKLGGGKLLLHPFGLALPHYADSSKVGYVLQGTGRVGIILSEASGEKVLKLKKGDIIPMPTGAVSWWFNDGDTDGFAVLFLGETSKAHTAGTFTYFFVAGSLGIFNGFTPDFITKALHLEEEEAKKIIKSQTGSLVVKLKESQKLPEPCKADTKKIVVNTDTVLPDMKVEKGGEHVIVKHEESVLLEEVGLSTISVKLHPNATYVSEYLLNPAFQMTYIVRGSGRVQVAGIAGKNAMDENVEAGQLFVVPRFFVISVIASGEGMEWFSVITAKQPTFGHLVGRSSICKALSPQVLQASLNISPELEQSFMAKISKSDIFFPPPNYIHSTSATCNGWIYL